MPGLYNTVSILALVAFLSGCAQGQRQSDQWTRIHSDNPSTVSAPESATATSPDPALPPQDASLLPPTALPAALTDARWVRLNHWAAATLNITPGKTTTGGATVFTLQNDVGTLLITAETRLATFNGATFWLGFAPFGSGNDCFVHEVDLQKNILPLLSRSSSPRTAPGTIVIDPGHGGTNLGTKSILPNVLEKELTLDWALRLEPLLQQQGWKVVLTRRDDRELSLTERVQVADRHQADLFVSLHFNSALPQTEQAGLETFCTTPVGLPSTLTRGYEDDVTRVFPNNAYDDDNLRYAMRLHQALLQAAGMNDRSVRRARFMGVLRSQQRPAVLLEAGYLSNPEEARRANTAEYRQVLAEAVAKALAPPPSLASNTVPLPATTAGTHSSPRP